MPRSSWASCPPMVSCGGDPLPRGGTFPTFALDVPNGSSRQKPTFNVRPVGISKGQNLADRRTSGLEQDTRIACHSRGVASQPDPVVYFSS